MRAVSGFVCTVAVVAAVLTGQAAAVEMTNLEGLDDIYGRYAPAGDCQREPRITVERSGITFESGGKTEKPATIEFAASYNGQGYEGIVKVVFPFSAANGYPLVMFFNQDEKPGVLVIQGHDEGWQGGPPLSPRNAVLVKGSPYGRCK